MASSIQKIGLTGGMGSGKSAVAKLFASHGAIVIDADEVARETRRPGSAGHAAILNRFQTDDRAELRRILASSPDAKRDLEGILHPLIQVESELRMQNEIASRPHAPCLIYEATLLIEAGRKADFDAILVVTAPLAARVSRVAARDKITEKEALLIIQTQNEDSFRLPHATWVIQNSGSPDLLEDQVRKVLDQIISA